MLPMFLSLSPSGMSGMTLWALNQLCKIAEKVSVAYCPDRLVISSESCLLIRKQNIFVNSQQLFFLPNKCMSSFTFSITMQWDWSGQESLPGQFQPLSLMFGTPAMVHVKKKEDKCDTYSTLASLSSQAPVLSMQAKNPE